MKHTKLFYLLPKATQRKLTRRKPAVCCICRKKLKWPNIVLYKYTHKMCKKCWKLTKEVEK